MDADKKKTALRMIPYGIYVMTAKADAGEVGARTVTFGFFKPAQLDGNKISGEAFHAATTGAPILESAIAAVECNVVETVERGDHHIVVGEVVDVHMATALGGRPDAAILEMKELGDNVFYGG